mgnify:FL=1
MRWCVTRLALKNNLPGLRPYSGRVICSSYLPEWGPGVDYRTVYSAHKALGGGVTIDLTYMGFSVEPEIPLANTGGSSCGGSCSSGSCGTH